MPQFLKFILLWLAYALPDIGDISNLLLAVLGVLMSLPKLAEKIEDHKATRYTLAVGCIVIGLLAFIVGVYQRRQATSQMTTLVGNVNILVTNTNSLVTSTNSVVTMVGTMLPQIAVLNSRIADLNLKIAAAKGNPQAIASLQAQLAAAREESSKISKQLLVVMVPGTSNVLESVGERWNAEKVQASKRNVPANFTTHLTGKWLGQAMPSMVTADSLRQQLLQKLPPSDRTLEDAKEAAVFAGAIKGEPVVHPDDLTKAAKYLRELSDRVAAPTGLPAGFSDDAPPCEVPPKQITANPGVAVLHSGFSIRYERKKTVGATTRLYVGDGACDSVIDIPTDKIDRFEGDHNSKAP